jgi:hypothetical protein
MKIYNLLIVLCFALVGCHTIHIKNDSNASFDYKQDEWHQIGVLELVEFSDPVDLSQRCEGKPWSSVRTRMSPGQAFLALVPYLSYAWTPQEVAISCK